MISLKYNVILERWPRGLRRTPGERVVGKTHPWVQIPPSPPDRDTSSRFFVTGGGVIMEPERIVEIVKEKARKVTEKYGLEVFDVHYRKERRGWVLRIVIDNPIGYVSIRHCELVSRDLERFLDSENIINKSYVLEVSSPGLDRPLRDEKDFIRFTGKLAKFIFKDGRVIIGRIERYENGIVKVLDGKVLKDIDIKDLKEARLEIEF